MVGRRPNKPPRIFEELTGPEKELMRKLARAHWTPEELGKFFRADIQAVNIVIKNTLKKKRKTKPKDLSNIKDRVLGSEGQ